jgi:hypothetical protein
MLFQGCIVVVLMESLQSRLGLDLHWKEAEAAGPSPISMHRAVGSPMGKCL